ncbi:hypothetical protein [Streptomyces sp. NPDC086782]|uniref:hypothetical protein n=1 Tax=Streptomyces sp. NPDC086782 TaxID=3365757 RepID=UPI00381C952E
MDDGPVLPKLPRNSAPAYQPGLIGLRGDIYDAAVYLDALTTSAAVLGDADLVQELREAGEIAHESSFQ